MAKLEKWRNNLNLQIYNSDLCGRVRLKMDPKFIYKKVNLLLKRAKELLSTVGFILSSRHLFQVLSFRDRPSVFSIELHASVSLDVKLHLLSSGIKWNRVSFSAHSHFFGEPVINPRYLNKSTWQFINEDLVKNFTREYQRYLKNQKGFIVSHSLSLLRLYERFNGKIFVINSTRFESPHTLMQEQFESLIELIKDLKSQDRMTIVSNNKGDQDYLKHFTGVDSVLLPSYCRYSPPLKRLDSRLLILSRNQELGQVLQRQIPESVTLDSAFHGPYSHEEFMNFSGVILIPYNISTMRLFEISTSGMPVYIPSDMLLKDWTKYPGVLSELSWVQVLGSPCPEYLKGTPADPKWPEFYDWWLNRADWKSKLFFPNVATFSTPQEVYELHRLHMNSFDISNRNQQLANSWKSVMESWVKSLE